MRALVSSGYGITQCLLAIIVICAIQHMYVAKVLACMASSLAVGAIQTYACNNTADELNLTLLSSSLAVYVIELWLPCNIRPVHCTDLSLEQCLAAIHARRPLLTATTVMCLLPNQICSTTCRCIARASLLAWQDQGPAAIWHDFCKNPF